jgi:hypothetical protein
MTDMILKINGNNIPLTEFPEEFIKGAIIGMVMSLKGVEKVQTVELFFSVNK